MAYPYPQEEMTQAIPDHYAQKLTAGRLGASMGNDAREIREASPLDRLMKAIALMEEATSRVTHMTDALCGSQPEAAGKSPSEPVPSGMFAAISLSANRIDRMAGIIIESMNRIQRVAG